MEELPEYVDGLPNICGSEQRIEEAIRDRGAGPMFLPPGAAGFDDVDSAFAVALHMHQPLVPAGGPDLRTAPIIGNLKLMLDNPGIGDNHNAPVFLWCYKRMGEFVPQLLDEGLAPRVMLEYSGTLLHGLRQMGANDVLVSRNGFSLLGVVGQQLLEVAVEDANTGDDLAGSRCPFEGFRVAVPVLDVGVDSLDEYTK